MLTPKSIRNDALDDGPYGPESDACAIYLSARKYGQSTFGTLKRSIGALIQMGHRTGFVNGEGDGAGVQTDVPRRLWARKLSQVSLRASLASQPGFWVGHLFIPAHADQPEMHDRIQASFDAAGLNLIYQQPGRTRREALGGNGRLDPPAFWQIAGYVESPGVEKRLLEVQTQLETEFPIHFLSLSPHVVVYKVRGSVETSRAIILTCRTAITTLRLSSAMPAIRPTLSRTSTVPNPLLSSATMVKLIPSPACAWKRRKWGSSCLTMDPIPRM